MKWSRLLSTKRNREICAPDRKDDLRSEFEKDYHRIISSASFRRLQDKTQVFPLDKSDFIRTRLTHTLEVSSFAKSLGQNVGQYIIDSGKDPEFTMETKADICDILECAGLIHDIGNPPFGHFGETVIREWFTTNLPKLSFEGKPVTEILNEQQLADLYNFEGNAQAFRLVNKLHFLVDNNGMNLTYALLSTIIKYPLSSLEMDPKSDDIKNKKMGYFLADKDLFEKVQEETGTNGLRNPLTFLLEAADDIAYKTADIEDAFKKGCISYTQFIEELSKVQMPEGADFDPVERMTHYFEKGKAMGLSRPGLYAISNFIVGVQGFLIRSATYGFTSHYDEIMEGTYKKDILAGTYGESLAFALSDIAYRYAFVSRPIYKMEITAGKVLDYLFDIYVKAVINYDTEHELGVIDEKVIEMISENYRNSYKYFSEGKSKEEKLYLRLLLVTDDICGMTDSYAKRLYQEFNGIIG